MLPAVGAAGNRTEVQQLATRTLGGKLTAARAGRYQGGPISFGGAIQARSEAGMILWTLETAEDGRRVQVFPDGREHWHDRSYVPGARQVREPDGRRRRAEQLFVVPTRMFPGRLETIRQIARWYLDEHLGPGAIAERLNALKRFPPGGRPFWWALVERVLRTPWTGHACYGRRTRHRYATIKGGVPSLSAGKGKLREKPRGEWVWSDERIFEPPVLDTATQEAIWSRLDADKAGPRRGRAPEYVLSTVVVCGRCGKVASGMFINRKGRKPKRVYRCADYSRYKENSPKGCSPLDVDQEILLAVVRGWLEETGRTLEEVTAEGESGLLRALYDERAAARGGLARLREAMEAWLSDALAEVFDHEELPDGRRRFAIEGPEGAAALVLPGAALADLLELHSWAWAGVSGRSRARLAELEAEHDRWFDLLARMPTDGTRGKAAARLREIEGETSRLRSTAGADPAAQLRGLLADLQRAQAALAYAGRELAGDEPRRISAAIRGAVGRIVINWSLADKGVARWPGSPR